MVSNLGREVKKGFGLGGNGRKERKGRIEKDLDSEFFSPRRKGAKVTAEGRHPERMRGI